MAAQFSRTLLYLICLYTSYLIVVAIHEAGHFLAARRARYNWAEVRIGPLMMVPSGRQVRYEFSGNFFGGHVRVSKPRGTESFNGDCLLIVAGVIANIVTGLALAYGYYYLPSALQEHLWMLDLIAEISFAAAFGSFLPIRWAKAGLDSDGLQFIHLMRYGRPRR